MDRIREHGTVKNLSRLVFRRRPPAKPSLSALKPSLLIFDFDGTIADTFEAGFTILNRLAEEFGFRPLGRDELEKARDMRTRQLMKFLKIPTRKMARIARRGSEELHGCIDSICPLPGVPELLQKLRSRGYELGIITSNTDSNVQTFLRNHDLEIFDFVHCSSKLLGKASVIRSVLKAGHLAPAEILFIGDETRDIEAAHKTGVVMAAVTWGYNSRHALEGQKPDLIFSTPAELAELLPARGEIAISC